jgi:CO/xanthine dehydrogenase Mo-binding subunit
MRDGDPAPLGEHIAHIRPEETLAKALEAANSKNAKSKNVGRGCAIGNWVSKGGESYAFVTIDEAGKVTLSSAVIDTGPGAYSIMRQIVGQELKVPLDDIRVEMLDTSKVIKDTGVRGSSSTRVHGSSAYEAASRAREEVLRAAAAAMATTPEQLMLYEGGVIHSRAERRMTLAEIVRARGAPIMAEGHYANMSDGPESSLVAQVAEVEVDEETGAVTVRRLTTAHNTGTIINPLTHQGQNIPELRTAIVQSQVGSGPYNSMSIGEHALIPTAAAIANAIEDAVGVRIASLPITAEKVLTELRKKS